MRLAEIFHSIQGEGGLAGTPSVFIRTSGCNLRCWFCDTPYTSWTPEGDQHEWQRVLADVLAIDCPHVVLTGGEPLLQPAVVPLTQALQAAGRHVTLETAGTRFRSVAVDLVSLSPKLANSTPTGRFADRHNQRRDNPETVRRLTQEFAYQLKFVIDTPGDLDDVTAWLDRFPHLDRGCVYLMPQARTQAELAAQTPWLTAAAAARGFRLSPRLHVEWWGNQRGV